MAYYAALVSLVQLLDDIILHHHPPNFLLGHLPIVSSLQKKVILLEESLQEYSSKGDRGNEHVERRIRDVAHRAQDIIESGISYQIDVERESETAEKKASQIQDRIEQHAKELQMAEEYVEFLRVIEEEVDIIVQELLTMKESQGKDGALHDFDSVGIGRSQKSPGARSIMVKFDEYLVKIKDQLCGHGSRIQVASIVGAGGIGKTTLATNVFDDALVVYHFDYRAWVTISQDYNETTVLLDILKSMGVNSKELSRKGGEALKEYTYKYLKGRRYLVVVDDIWSTEVWDALKRIFPDDCNGSRVLLTTRLSDVAEYASTSEFFQQINFLSEGDSWNLFREKAFGQGHCSPELEVIGKSIVKKCGGLPLAIAVLAGILSNVRTPDEWKKIEMNVSTTLSESDDLFSSTLRLSYNHLPHQLKACFLYLGSLPGDYKIKISRLTWLWIAEGFVKFTGGSKTLEKIAEERLEDLVKRNLVIVIDKATDGRFKYCIMHDLLREFCRQRALDEYFFHRVDSRGNIGTSGAYDSVRRIILKPSTRNNVPSQFSACSFVRSFLLFGKKGSFFFADIEWGDFKLLKVLDMFDARLLQTPDGITGMFHLKYLTLNLVGEFHTDLSSIFQLRNLETIIIWSSFEIILPSEIWHMRRLRHLIMNWMMLPSIPLVGGVRVCEVEYLQTFETTRNFIFTKEAIERIPNLRKLAAICLSDGDPRGVWKLHGLNNLASLLKFEKLNIRSNGRYHQYDDSFRSSFAFPQTLRKLSLEGCGLHWEDLTTVGSLPCLQVLKLKEGAVTDEVWEPIEGQFQRLRFLLMFGLSVEHWEAGSTHFPCLEHLKIVACHELREIPLEIGDIPTLSSITVHNCQLVENSAKMILEEQQSQGNDALQVVVR